MSTSRVGKFKVAGMFFRRIEMIDGKMAGANLFDGMVVVQIERDFGTDQVTYYGLHPQFREVPTGEQTPEYTAAFDCGSVTPRWTEVPAFKMNLEAVADQAWLAARFRK